MKDKIKAPDDFKRKVKLEVKAHAGIPKMSQTKKIHFTIREMAIVASILGIAIILIWQINAGMYKSNTVGALPPYFTLNNIKYWDSPYIKQTALTALPDTYKFVGSISSNSDTNFGDIGDKIYMDPANLNAAYLYTDLYAEKGNFRYLLFVTQAVRNVLICYNGSTYIMDNQFEMNHDEKPWAESVGFKCVGTVKAVDYTRVPSRQLETDFVNSLGCDVYASESNPNIIYINQTKISNGQYLEMKKQ